MSSAQVLRKRLIGLVDRVLAECSAANTVDHMDVEAVVDLLKGHLQASAAAKAMSAGEHNRARCQPWLARARCPSVARICKLVLDWPLAVRQCSAGRQLPSI